MTTIKSKEVIVDRSAGEVFDYLTDMNNFKELLPQDRISNWESDEKQCSFKIQGTVTISIRMKDSTKPTLINLESGDKSPFPFTLDVDIEELAENQCKAGQTFNAKINPFLKMMVEKPLSNLFNYIADKLVEVKGGRPA